MARRYDLIGRHKNPLFDREGGEPKHGNKRKKQICLATAVKGFLIVCALNAGLALAVYTMNPGAFDVAIHSGRVGTNFCAKAFHLIPEAWETATTCRVFNAVPFLVMPGFVLLYLVRRLLRDGSRG